MRKEAAMHDPQAPIRILLVDEQSLFRQAMAGVLDGQPGMQIVAEAEDAPCAVRDAKITNPNVAFLDANLMRSGLASTVTCIKESAPGCEVIVLSSHRQTAELAEALLAGASAYLTKEAPIDELIRATRSVHRGETVVPPEMVGPLLALLLDRRGERAHLVKRLARLTKREREVLALLAEGADKGVIAERLVISPQTARTHIQNILEKLGVHSRLEAAAFARQHEILRELVPT